MQREEEMPMTDPFVVGLELNEKDVRVCVYDTAKKKAVSVMTGEDKNAGDSPAHMAFDVEKNIWCFGTKADQVVARQDSVLYDNVYEKCLRAETFPVSGGETEPHIVLGELMKQALEQADIKTPAASIRVMVLTVPVISQKLTFVVEEAFRYMGMSEKQAFLQDYNESFFTHTYYQKSEVFNRNAGLYYFPDETKAQFRMLKSDSNTRPTTVMVEEFPETTLPMEPKERDARFCEYIRQTTQGEEFSGFFLVGRGFERYWARESLLLLCKAQRKVFYGNNLFAKGACYSALEKTDRARINNVLFLGNDLVRKNIGIELISHNQPVYHPLIAAGIHWFEAESGCEVILNNENRVVFRVDHMENRKRTKLSMPLDNLPKRPPRTTRLRIRLKFTAVDKCEVTVTDLGFGEMFPSSGMVWKDYL